MDDTDEVQTDTDSASITPGREPAKIQSCPECHSTRLMRDYECAEIVCMNCGYVLAAKITDRDRNRQGVGEKR